MRCPFQKIVIVRDNCSDDVTITKHISTKFGECLLDECPYFDRLSLALAQNGLGEHKMCKRCESRRCENESKI